MTPRDSQGGLRVALRLMKGAAALPYAVVQKVFREVVQLAEFPQFQPEIPILKPREPFVIPAALESRIPPVHGGGMRQWIDHQRAAFDLLIMFRLEVTHLLRPGGIDQNYSASAAAMIAMAVQERD